MKIKYLFLVLILTSFFAGCKDSDSENCNLNCLSQLLMMSVMKGRL